MFHTKAGKKGGINSLGATFDKDTGRCWHTLQNRWNSWHRRRVHGQKAVLMCRVNVMVMQPGPGDMCACLEGLGPSPWKEVTWPHLGRDPHQPRVHPLGMGLSVELGVGCSYRTHWAPPSHRPVSIREGALDSRGPMGAAGLVRMCDLHGATKHYSSAGESGQDTRGGQFQTVPFCGGE